MVNSLDYKEADLKVFTDRTSYYFDEDKETIIEATKDDKTELGCGKIVIKASYKKGTKTKEARIEISVELTPDYEKDYEIIPYSPNEVENQQNIANFMAKYITKPFTYIDNTIGVEINFNKVFYKPEELRSLKVITTDLQGLEDDLKQLEQELAQAKMAQEAEIAAKQQENILYIVGGNTIVILIAGILFLVMRRKKAKT